MYHIYPPSKRRQQAKHHRTDEMDDGQQTSSRFDPNQKDQKPKRARKTRCLRLPDTKPKGQHHHKYRVVVPRNNTMLPTARRERKTNYPKKDPISIHTSPPLRVASPASPASPSPGPRHWSGQQARPPRPNQGADCGSHLRLSRPSCPVRRRPLLRPATVSCLPLPLPLTCSRRVRSHGLLSWRRWKGKGRYQGSKRLKKSRERGGGREVAGLGVVVYSVYLFCVMLSKRAASESGPRLDVLCSPPLVRNDSGGGEEKLSHAVQTCSQP